MHNTLLKISVLGLSILTFVSTGALAQPAHLADPIKPLSPVTEEMLGNPPAADWLMWRRTYDAWGYSPLDSINKGNVKRLQVAWTWALATGATEITPIVHDGVLFIFNYADKVQALNAVNGDLLWEYKRDLPAPLVAAGGNVLAKRNMAIFGDTLIVATSDAYLIALNVNTGKIAWEQAVADWTKGWRYTGGPMVAGGKIVQGMSGCGNAQPGGCFISGHDPKNGAEAWRFYAIARPGEPGGDTWNGVPLEKRHGASVWNSGSYDAESKTLFFGVGQPYPWIAEMNGLTPQKDGLKNNALYTDCTLALDPETGKLKWHFQHLATDTWDLDYAYERILVDLPMNGTTRKALVTVGKLGIIEVLDRTTGEFLWHKETVYQNVVTGINPKTGEKTINQDAIPHIGKTTVNCPADPGSRGWPATAYSPKTNMLYLPSNEYCADTTPTPLDPGQIYTGGGRAVYARKPIPNSDGNIGRVDAVRLDNQQSAWSYRTRAPQTAAVLSTGGGLVFSGAWDRYFRAFDDETGTVLWQVRTSNAVNSFPITYSVNGKQYVAVSVGNGSSHARSLSTLTPEIRNPDGGSSLWVFALPDE
jgi:alcohol dehydrogenase (cytochrome c)